MQIIGALFLTCHVMDWLGNSSHPRILHVFDHVCNLINEQNEVSSIVTQSIGNGPFNLVIDDEILFSEHVNVESSVFIFDHGLKLGNFVIDTSGAKLWKPSPDWKSLHNDRDRIADQLQQLPITNYLKLDGFDTPLDDYSGLLNHRYLLLPNSLIYNLTFALARADISSAKNIASKLAGLGIGLTPSGDDFMMGSLYAVWIIHPPEIAGTLAQEIAYTAAPLTSSLSGAWLRSAGRGEAGILWHEFFAALMFSEAMQTKSAMDQILAVGATSGADAFAGFISTFVAYVEFEKRHVIPKFI